MGRHSKTRKMTADRWADTRIAVETLKRQMAENKLSIDSLAEATGFTRDQIDMSLRTKCDKNSLTIETFEGMTQYFGLEPEQVLPEYKKFLNHTSRPKSKSEKPTEADMFLDKLYMLDVKIAALNFRRKEITALECEIANLCEEILTYEGRVSLSD